MKDRKNRQGNYAAISSDRIQEVGNQRVFRSKTRRCPSGRYGPYMRDEIFNAEQAIDAVSRLLDLKMKLSRFRRVSQLADALGFRFPDRSKAIDKLMFLGDFIRTRKLQVACNLDLWIERIREDRTSRQ